LPGLAAVIVLLAAASAPTAATTTAAWTATATAAISTAATAVTAATATRSLFALASLVDVQGTATEVLLVEGFDRLGSVVTGHLDEAKAAGASGLAVSRQDDRHNLAILREELSDILFARAKREIPYVDPLIQAFTPTSARPTNRHLGVAHRLDSQAHSGRSGDTANTV
jgi:hypothetical protein